MEKTIGWGLFSVFVVLALILGGIAGAFVFPKEITKEVVKEVPVEKIVEKIVEVENTTKIDLLQKQVDDLNKQVADLNKQITWYKQFDSVIAKYQFDQELQTDSVKFLGDENYKLFNWLNSEYNLSIERESDVSVSEIDNFDITEISEKDGKYKVTFDVKASYYLNSDLDTIYHTHVTVTVMFDHLDADTISFAEKV